MALDLHPSELLQPSNQATFRPTAEGGIIVNVESGDCFTLNATGALLWACLANRQCASERELVDELVSKFEVSEEIAASSVRKWIQQAYQARLIIGAP